MASDPPPPPTDRASPLLRERVRAVFKRLPKSLAGDEEAIHEMRVAGRRLRVAIPLLAKRPEGKRVKRAVRVLRELTRAAGASRDLDVCLDLLNAHLHEQGALSRETPSCGAACEPPAPAAGPRWRRPSWTSRSPASGATCAGSWRGRRTACSGSWAGSGPPATRKAKALLAGFRGLGDRYDPEALHALRRRARRLRYTAEVHDTLMRGEPSEAPSLFKSLQEQIGALHDVHVLARWLEAQAKAAAERGQTAQTEAAAALQAAFEDEGPRSSPHAPRGRTLRDRLAGPRWPWVAVVRRHERRSADGA